VDWIHLALDRNKWREGSCERGNEPWRFIKGRKLLDYLSDYWLLKKDSAPWN
jgi:hypothetical protein